MGSLELINKSIEQYSQEELLVLSVIFPWYTKEKLEYFFNIDWALLWVHLIKMLYKFCPFDPEDIKPLFSNKDNLFSKYIRGKDLWEILHILNMISLNINTRKKLIELMIISSDIEFCPDNTGITTHELTFLFSFNPKQEVLFMNLENTNYKLINWMLRIKSRNWKTYSIVLDDLTTWYLWYTIFKYNKKFKKQRILNRKLQYFQLIFQKFLLKIIKKNLQEFNIDLNEIILEQSQISFHIVQRKKHKWKPLTTKKTNKTTTNNSTLLLSNFSTCPHIWFTYLDPRDYYNFDSIEEIIHLCKNSNIIEWWNIKYILWNIPNDTWVIQLVDILQQINKWLVCAARSWDKNDWWNINRDYVKFLSYFPLHLYRRFWVYDVIEKYKMWLISKIPKTILSLGSWPHEEFRAWYDISKYLNNELSVPTITNVDFSQESYLYSLGQMSKSMRESLYTYDLVWDIRNFDELVMQSFDMIECSSFESIDNDEYWLKRMLISIFKSVNEWWCVRFILYREFSDEFIDLLKIHWFDVINKFWKIIQTDNSNNRSKVFYNKTSNLWYFFAVKRNQINIVNFIHDLVKITVYKKSEDWFWVWSVNYWLSFIIAIKSLLKSTSDENFYKIYDFIKIHTSLIDMDIAKLLFDWIIKSSKFSDKNKNDIIKLLKNVKWISEVINIDYYFRYGNMSHIIQIMIINKREFFVHIVNSKNFNINEKLILIKLFLYQWNSVNLLWLQETLNLLLDEYIISTNYMRYRDLIYFILETYLRYWLKDIIIPNRLKSDPYFSLLLSKI